MELWDAYDKNEQKTGVDLFPVEAIPKGMYHLVAEILVQHKDGTYLLMKRSEYEGNNPGCEEIGVLGNILKGETVLDGAFRMLQAKAGIKAERFRPMYHLISEAQQSIYYGYLCVTDYPKDFIELQGGGSSASRWISEEEMLLFYDSEKCIPIQKFHLEDYIAYLRGSIS